MIFTGNPIFFYLFMLLSCALLGGCYVSTFFFIFILLIHCIYILYELRWILIIFFCMTGFMSQNRCWREPNAFICLVCCIGIPVNCLFIRGKCISFSF